MWYTKRRPLCLYCQGPSVAELANTFGSEAMPNDFGIVLMNGMMKIILDEGLEDKFIKTEGYEAFEAVVQNMT